MALNTGDHPEDDVERTKEITKEDIKKKRKIKKTNLRKGER